MKFNLGDKFYIFEEGTYYDYFQVKTYRVSDILMQRNNVYMYRSCDTNWFSEKECLTKEEVIEKINKRIEKIKRK